MTTKEQFVYVLSMDDDRYPSPRKQRVLGVYTSKTAAVEAAGSVELSYGGTFDELIENMSYDEESEEFDYRYSDNRENPPDDGSILRLMANEADSVTLKIQKFPLDGGVKGKTSTMPSKKTKADATIPHDDAPAAKQPKQAHRSS